MLYYIIRRILFAIPVLLIASVVIFVFMRATTDPAQALRNPRMTAEDLQRIKEAYGLDKSGPEQYTSWLTHFVQGEWGVSIRRQAPVAPIVGRALKNTVMLMIPALLLSITVSMFIGVYSAVRRYSPADYAFTGFSFLGLSMPTFWFALILKLVLGFHLMQWLGRDEPLFYTVGMRASGATEFQLIDFLRHAALPSLVLSVQLIAGWGRYERASMLEILGSDYMRTARAKGLSERRVILKHGLRNALIPFVTIAAIDIGGLFGGLIITEQIFSWPGTGQLFLNSLGNGDYPVVLPALMVTAAFVILFNLIADILYGILDPRIRYG